MASHALTSSRRTTDYIRLQDKELRRLRNENKKLRDENAILRRELAEARQEPVSA